MTYNLTVTPIGYTIDVPASVTIDTISVAAIADAGTVGRAVLLSETANAARTAIERQDFPTRADFVAWADGKTPTTGLVMRAAGLSYRYTGTGTAIADLPGWEADGFPNRRAAHTVYNPTFTRVQVAGGDGLYRHDSTVTQAADGKLHAFWSGNAASASESATGQRIFHATSSDGGANWTTAVAVHSESSTNTLTPTAIQSTARAKAVGSEVWMFFGNRGTSGEEAFIWGILSSAGVWTWKRLLFDASNVPSWSSTDLSGAPASGYSLYSSIEGDTVSITITDLLIRDDGGVDLLLVGLTTFAIRHHMFLMRMASTGAFTLVGSPIPSGQDLIPNAFEGSLLRLADGGYVVHGRRLINYAGGPLVALDGGERQFRAESPDGMGWTATETTGLRIHSTRGHVLALSDTRWMIAANSSWATRNDLCIGVSSDPRTFVLGPLSSNEDIDTEYRHYPELTLYTYSSANRVGMICSGGLQSAAAPNEIHWVSFLPPSGSNMTAQTTSQRKNRSDAAAVSTASGAVITIPPHGSMSWEPTAYDVELRSIRWRVDTLPGGIPYTVAAIGNTRRSAQVQLVLVNGFYLLRVDGQVLGAPITDPTQWQTLVIELDKRAGVARVMGRDVLLPKGEISVTCGDAFDQTWFSTGTAGNLLIDADYCTVAELTRLASSSDVANEGGPNLFLNPEFANPGLPSGAVDLVSISDAGGCGLSLFLGNYSVGASVPFSGAVQTHLRLLRTSAGSTAPRMDFKLGSVMLMAGQNSLVEFDAYDAASLDYAVEVYAHYDFGTGGIYTEGGTQTISYRIGAVLIDNYISRRHAIECPWPTISGTAVLGEGHFCTLQFRPLIQTLATDADLRVGRMDVHQGTSRRRFPKASGLAQKDFTFATRADFVTWMDTATVAVGSTASVLDTWGTKFRYIASGTGISDLAGWVPDGDITPNHWTQNVTPRTTDMTTAIQAAITYAGTLNASTQGRPPVVFRGEEYLVSSAITIAKDFTKLKGVGSRATLIVAATDFGTIFTFSAADPTTTSIVSPAVEGIGFRVFFNSSATIAIRMVRALEAKILDVEANYLFGGLQFEGGQNIFITNYQHQYGAYSSSVTSGSFGWKFREGPAAASKTPSNVHAVNFDIRADSQTTPYLDCAIDIGCIDGLTMASGHLLGAAGKGAIYCKPQVTALSTTGATLSWITGVLENDGGSTYGINLAKAVDGGGVAVTAANYGNINIKGIASRPSINHVFTEAGCQAQNISLDLHAMNAGDSGYDLNGGSNFVIRGSVRGSGINGTSGKRSGLVLNNDVTHVSADLDFDDVVGDTHTQTVGVEVKSASVDYVNITGKAFDMANPVDDIFSYGTNTGHKVYDVASSKHTIYNTAVVSGAIQRTAYAKLVVLDPGDTADITGITYRHFGATIDVWVLSTRLFVNGTGNTALYLKNGQDFLAHSGDVLTFVYAGEPRGWIETSRNAIEPVCLGAPSTLTIASGVITVSAGYHFVDTEGAAGTDDLVTINGGSNGQVLILGTVDSGRDVVIKNGTGNIFCGADITLDNVADKITLIKYGSGQWHMTSHANN